MPQRRILNCESAWQLVAIESHVYLLRLPKSGLETVSANIIALPAIEITVTDV